MTTSQLELSLYVDLMVSAYKTKDVEFIQRQIKEDFDKTYSSGVIADYLNVDLKKDYEKESRTHEFSLTLSDIFSDG